MAYPNNDSKLSTLLPMGLDAEDGHVYIVCAITDSKNAVSYVEKAIKVEMYGENIK